ncbi:MAG: hypothetical protein NDJ92_17890, partial [Thermoanaerobaculia bacterium]|nr:hypothetical protein [Thermoanaerobaculia bacterium]
MEIPAHSGSEPDLRLLRAVVALIATTALCSGALAIPPAAAPPAPSRLLRPSPAHDRHAVSMREGLAALGSGDGAAARRHLSSFTYLARPIEQARLYWLALAAEMDGETSEARRTLARLRWRGARIASRDDALGRLAALYEQDGHWSEAASVLAELRATARTSEAAQRAFGREMTARLALGDPGAVLSLSRRFASEHATDPRAAESLAIAVSLTGAAAPLDALDPRGQLARAWTVARSGDPVAVLAELDAAGPPEGHSSLRSEWGLVRAFTLQRLGKYKESARVLSSL